MSYFDKINSATGDRFRWGDVREDGFIFDHHWRSPESFNKRCDNNKTRKANFSNKVSAWVDKKKLHKGCQHCGYKKHAVALVYHHTDPSTKKGDISTMHKNTFSRFKKIVLEIWKCIVLCANCHNVEHQRLRELDAKN